LRQQIEQGTSSPAWSVIDDLVLYKGAYSFLRPQSSGRRSSLPHMGKAMRVPKRCFNGCTIPSSIHMQHVESVILLRVAACQRNKSEPLHPTRPLHPLELPSPTWTDIAMDFVEGFPKSGGKSVILTVVDHFSKNSHFIALNHPYTAVSVARAFFDNIVWLHGIPCSIVSDRDPIFTSTFWRELFSLTGTQLHMSTTFHPQTDGQSEVTNSILCVYLRCLAGERPKSWL
jgi:hypothetical protein